MGELGLMPSEFYALTWGQYQRAALGYLIRLDRGWDYTRNIIAASISPYSKQPVSLQSIHRCIFDTQQEPVNAEEFELIKKAWKL